MEPVTYNEAGVKAAYMYSSNGECIDGEESKNNGRAVESLEKGAMQYGVDQKLRHDIPRHQVTQVICSLCGTEQEVQQVCINCGVCMGEYFCDVCKLFDDDISKKQYHCSGCGICRIGGRENFFHCYKCGCCYSMLLKNSHPCVEGAMHHDCPVCFEFLFESLSDITVLPCGHTIHTDCLKEMQEHAQYACPLCSKSVCDMSRVWEKFDVEIAATPMPEPYQNKLVWILCNDCGKTSKQAGVGLTVICQVSGLYPTNGGKNSTFGPAAACWLVLSVLRASTIGTEFSCLVSCFCSHYLFFTSVPTVGTPFIDTLQWL
ncbi:43kDa postsynaptic protein [Trema orientale]|uniref:43kDa postsynaptic protein n=1 Tax=Trema orientale TaxID=63057 RepID=A0A2P5G159_TREOI|nr:43kDa postsynaptic protein [Trema orientale]